MPLSFWTDVQQSGNICGVLLCQLEHLASAEAAFGAGVAQRVTCVIAKQYQVTRKAHN